MTTSHLNNRMFPLSERSWLSYANYLLLAGVLFILTFAAKAQTAYPLGANGSMGLGSANGDFTVAQDDLQVKVPGGFIRINRDFDGERWVFNRQWSGLGTPSYYKATYASLSAFLRCSSIDGVSSCDSTATPGAMGASNEPFGIQQARVPNDPYFGRDEHGEPLSGPSTAETIARKGVGFTRSADGATYVSSKYPRFVVRVQMVPVLPVSAGPDAHPSAGKPGQGGIATTMENGFRWTDRSGAWIEYDNLGRISSYGDRNDVRVWMQYGSHGQLERVLDDNGRTVFTFLYSGNGSFITEVRDHTPVGGSIRRVQYGYDDDHRLHTVTDPLSHVTTFDYGRFSDNSGLTGLVEDGWIGSDPGTGGDGIDQILVVNTKFSIKKVTDAENRVTRIGYGATRRISNIVAPDGAITAFQYGYDKLKKEFNVTVFHPQTASGRKIETSRYDAEGRLVYLEVNGKRLMNAQGGRSSMTYTDELGRSMKIDRNNFDEVTRKLNPDGSSIDITYDSASINPKKVVDEAGYLTEMEYDSRGNLVKLQEAKGLPQEEDTEYEVNGRGEAEVIHRIGGLNADGSPDQDVELRLAYDVNGNIRSLIDGEGKTWSYSYDAQGNLVEATDPLGHAWSYTYDVQGNRLTATDANGLTSHYAYDNTDRLLSVVDARGARYRVEYDAVGRSNKVIDPTGATLTQEYDEAGRMINAFDSLNQRMQLDYDNQDRVASMTDGEGNTTNFDYTDAEGVDRGSDLASKVNYPTLQRLLRYNSRQNLTQLTDVVDGETRTTKAEYDARGAVTSATNTYAKSASTTYNAFGRPQQGTDELGQTVQLAYDHRGNLRSVTDELGHTTHLQYDRRDKLIKETNAVGQATLYSYDDAGRIQELLRPNGFKLTFQFDAGGRLKTRKSFHPDGSLELTDSFIWDDGNRLIGWTTNQASSTSSFDEAGRLLTETVTVNGVLLKRSYTYYANGQVQTYTGPDHATITYDYDGNGELSRVDIPGDGSISVIERKWAAPSKVVLPGGTLQEIEQDGLLSPTRFRVRAPNQSILFDQQSIYGGLEERTSLTTQGQRIDFSYDDALRLRKAKSATWGGVDEVFDLDAAGNRLTDGAAASTWLYDDANRLLERHDVNYEYDPAGNQIKKTDASLQEPFRTTSYIYDAYNRLTEVRDGASQVVSRYTYDPLGYRLSKEVTSIGSTRGGAIEGKKLFMQSAEGLLAEVGMDGEVLQSYGWQPEGIYSTAPLFLRSSHGYFYFQNDSRGIPRQLVDHAGTVAWVASSVFSYGSVVASAGENLSQPWRLPGQYLDAETGLHYNLYRYYDPATGRYIQDDPIGIDGGINTYLYAQANPNLYADPLGLFGTRDALSFVPVLGSLLDAIDDFRCGHLGMGILNLGLAALDATGVGAVAKGLTVGTMKWGSRRAVRSAYKNTNKWNTMRRKLQKADAIPTNTWNEARRDWLTTDHIFFKQRQKLSPKITNHPANLQTEVPQWLNSRFEGMSPWERAKYLPPWMKLGGTGVVSYATGLFIKPVECDCN